MISPCVRTRLQQGEVARRVAVLVSQSQRECSGVQGRIKVVSGKKLLQPCFFFFLEKNILGIEFFS